MTQSNGIGTLREQSLHADLKRWMAQRGDRAEVLVDGFHIDILRGDLLIEIQTRNFSAIKKKLKTLLQEHEVLLVHPIPQAKWIVKLNKRGKQVSRRKSPKKGRVENVFDELIRFPKLATHPNLSLQVLLTHEEELWRDDGKGSWRRKHWSIADRRLLEVQASYSLEGLADYLGLLPEDLPRPFSNKELAKRGELPIRLSQKMTYCLRHMEALELADKRGNAHLYSPVHPG